MYSTYMQNAVIWASAAPDATAAKEKAWLMIGLILLAASMVEDLASERIVFSKSLARVDINLSLTTKLHWPLTFKLELIG